MNTLLKIITTIVFVAILLWLTFANRDSVQLNWSPVNEPIDVPVAVLVLITTVGGFIWGGLIVWLNGAPVRRERRHHAKHVSRLEKELSAAGSAGNMAQTPTPPLLP